MGNKGSAAVILHVNRRSFKISFTKMFLLNISTMQWDRIGSIYQVLKEFLLQNLFPKVADSLALLPYLRRV